jgi:predicted ATP-grasp superfamily ATP-dependent carboligase
MAEVATRLASAPARKRETGRLVGMGGLLLKDFAYDIVQAYIICTTQADWGNFVRRRRPSGIFA